MPFFSIVIPTYNRASLIPATLQSVFQQTFTDYEIIIINDGSTDNTQDVLKPFLSRITYVNQNNQGPGAARNTGIDIAKGEYITFLDSDDLWFSWSLKTYNEVIKKENYPIFVAGNSISFQEDNELKVITPKVLKYEAFNDYYQSCRIPLWLLPCAVAIRGDWLKESKGFTQKNINAEDSDLWLRLGCAKGFVFIDSPALFAYRQHQGSAISDRTKTYLGVRYLINQENHNIYPGGKSRQQERLQILTRHVRSVSLHCLNEGEVTSAFKLYSETFWWHLKLFRVKYLLGFLLLTIIKIIQKFINKSL